MMNMDKKSLMKIITQASFALDDTRPVSYTHLDVYKRQNPNLYTDSLSSVVENAENT